MKKIGTSLLCLLLSAVLLFSCASCGLTLRAKALSDGYSRQVTDRAENGDAFLTAATDFSLSLFRHTVTQDAENDLMSPLSALICLAMLANGADGETLAQMEAAFGMDMDTLNPALYAFTSSLYRSSDCKVALADSLWFRNEENRLHLTDEFLQTNVNWYDAQIYGAPFDSSTVKDINAWCKKQTDGMIDRILDSIDPQTVLYLLNALTFDAQWAKKYEKKDISRQDFHCYDGSVSRVEMLSSGEATYLEADGVTGFAKPYSGNRYSFVGLLPTAGSDVYDWIATLDGSAWRSLWDGRRSESVDVQMPEFTYELCLNLCAPLSAMGMTDLFDPFVADFSRMGTSEFGNLYCEAVCQKVFIQVDRNGTKAAAITWAKNGEQCAAVSGHQVTLDRPFIYAIVDNATGLPLFLGAVTSL